MGQLGLQIGSDRAGTRLVGHNAQPIRNQFLLARNHRLRCSVRDNVDRRETQGPGVEIRGELAPRQHRETANNQFRPDRGWAAATSPNWSQCLRRQRRPYLNHSAQTPDRASPALTSAARAGVVALPRRDLIYWRKPKGMALIGVDLTRKPIGSRVGTCRAICGFAFIEICLCLAFSREMKLSAIGATNQSAAPHDVVITVSTGLYVVLHRYYLVGYQGYASICRGTSSFVTISHSTANAGWPDGATKTAESPVPAVTTAPVCMSM